MPKKTTIQNIADKLNINMSTVSRALNDFPNIKDETKQKVFAAAKKMNYCPNHIARGLTGKNIKVFALITPKLDPHVLPVIRGVTDACNKLGFALMLFPNDYWSDESIVFADIKRKWLVDGILIFNVVHRKNIDDNIKKLSQEKIPFVFIKKYFGFEKVNTVSIDNYDAVDKIVGYLYSLGRRRIGIINGNLHSVDGFERFDAYKKSLKKYNLPYDESIVGYGEFGKNEAYNEMKKILSASNRPTAVFCSSDLMAIHAIKAIKDTELKVPKDISVVGFDDIALSGYLKPALTTVRCPLEDVGKEAVKLLMEVIEGKCKSIKKVSLNTELLIRDSACKIKF